MRVASYIALGWITFCGVGFVSLMAWCAIDRHRHRHERRDLALWDAEMGCDDDILDGVFPEARQ